MAVRHVEIRQADGRIQTYDFDTGISTSQIGAAGGVASLDDSGVIPVNQIPAAAKNIAWYDDLISFPTVGDSDHIYIDKGTNIAYVWNSNTYSSIGSSIDLTDDEITTLKSFLSLLTIE